MALSDAEKQIVEPHLMHRESVVDSHAGTKASLPALEDGVDETIVPLTT